MLVLAGAVKNVPKIDKTKVQEWKKAKKLRAR